MFYCGPNRPLWIKRTDRSACANNEHARFARLRLDATHALRLGISAPADSIYWTATVHRRSGPHSNTCGADAGGHHGSRDRSRPQNHAGPYDASSRIRNVLAVNYGTGLFSACGHEPSCQQRRQRDRKLHLASFEISRRPFHGWPPFLRLHPQIPRVHDFAPSTTL
jgi:hypothetical protein